MRRPARSTDSFIPSHLSLPTLREAAARCTGCDLYKQATQTVFGEGATQASILLVGEQPGDQEDRAGHPFVGPAGKILDKALTEAGIDRRDLYVTNAVKHFKWEPQGKRRKHKKPSVAEIAACRPWLEAELQVVQPRVVVCLVRPQLNQSSPRRSDWVTCEVGHGRPRTPPPYLLRSTLLPSF